ncbi:MAG: polyphosphate polymerase domain-containing protein [Chloroflexota bacterium]|nr:polyphosphate polymerase domain-containing protein [Chloroflexota bacterium]
MSDYSQQIRKFNRFELKYLITLRQAGELKAILKKYMLPDAFGNRDNRYQVASLYYDSPDLRCYWENENGIKTRRKLRVRYYDSDSVITEQTQVFVEIKQRVDRVTQKRRAILPYIDALQLCQDRKMPECDPDDRPLVEEAYVFLWQYNLIPASIIRYDRQALVGTIYDPGLRVTFDTDITLQLHPLRLHDRRPGLPLTSPNQVVMEIKVNERMPYWLTELIAAKNLNLIRISKYCTGIEAAWEMPEFQCRNLISESTNEVLSSTYSLPLFWENLCKSKENSIKKEKENGNY